MFMEQFLSRLLFTKEKKNVVMDDNVLEWCNRRLLSNTLDELVGSLCEWWSLSKEWRKFWYNQQSAFLYLNKLHSLYFTSIQEPHHQCFYWKLHIFNNDNSWFIFHRIILKKCTTLLVGLAIAEKLLKSNYGRSKHRTYEVFVHIKPSQPLHCTKILLIFWTVLSHHKW